MYRLREYATLTLDLMGIASQLLELSMQKRVGINYITYSILTKYYF